MAINILDKLIGYIKRYETLTGKKPGAIPISELEFIFLEKQVECFMVSGAPINKLDEEYRVSSVGGIDLYFDENAEKSRNI